MKPVERGVMSSADHSSAAPIRPVAGNSDRDAQLHAHFVYCERLLRAHDRDRWLACMFAPAAARPRLHALYAFSMEIARIRESVNDPMPGEIRMQWWVDAIQGEARGDVRSHPVADALIDTIRRYSLPRTAFVDLIEARRFDLYDDPMADMNALETYCGHTSSALFRLAAIILADGKEPGGVDAAGYAGVAYALTGLLRAFAWHAAAGQIYVPADLLQRNSLTPAAALLRPAKPGLKKALGELLALARRRHCEAVESLSGVAPDAAPAFVALAPIPLYLKAMEQPGYQPFAADARVAQWRRQWAMWRFARRFG